MAGLVRYIVQPLEILAGRNAAEWWRQYFRWQLGEAAGAPGDLQFFGASEPLSNTYDGMLVGSVVGVLLFARRRGDETTADLAGRWLTMWTCAAALGASSPRTKLMSHHLGGVDQLAIPRGVNVPSIVAVGGRSTNKHYGDDPRPLLLAELSAWPKASHPWPTNEPWNYWFLQLCDLCGSEFGVPLEVAADARMLAGSGDLAAADRLAACLVGTQWKPFEFLRWADAVVGLMPGTVNGNTVFVPGSVLWRDGRADHFFPWPAAKAKGTGSGRAWIEAGELHVESHFGRLHPLRLPEGPPLRHWRFTSTGVHVSGGTKSEPEPQPGAASSYSRLSSAADLVVGLKLSRKEQARQVEIVALLREGVSRETLAGIYVEIGRFGINPMQKQAAQWHEAMRIIEAALALGAES
jgi:hypothetical protein